MCVFSLGLGIWYYRSRKNQSQQPITKTEKQNKNKSPESNDISVDIENKTELKGKSGKENNVEQDDLSAVVQEEDPYKQAQTYKNKGNKYFKDGKYADAIKCYQQAIEVCPKTKVQDVSTFHQNRAAAYEQLVS